MTKFKQNNTFRRAALTLLALIMTCATAWAETVTYTFYYANSISYIVYNGTNYQLSSNRYWTTGTATCGDVVVTINSANGNQMAIWQHPSSGVYMSDGTPYSFSFSSSSKYISHVKIYTDMNNYEADNDTHSHTTPGLWNNGGYGRFYQVDLTLSDTQPVYTYNISYELNGGTNAPGNPTTYTNLTGATLADATKTGYTFDGWYDNAGFNGTAITYIQPGPTGDKTVYAKWTANTYAVAFNNNGGSGTMAAQTHTYDASLALTSNTFTRTGYTFTGWATNPDGTGNTYTNGQTVQNLTTTNGATITLYAQWAPITYTVSFNNNGGTGTMSDQSFTYDLSQALTTNTFTRTGYSFAGWATSANGNVVYTNGQTVSNLASTQGANVELFAKWTPITYTVSFNANGGTGTMSNQSFTYNASQALTSNTFTRTGYTFAGWATTANGNVIYTNGQIVSNLASTQGANVELFAKWNPITYTVSFDANGGTGTMAAQTHTYDVSQALTANTFTLTGYSFDGWATTAGGNVVYTDEQSVSNLASTQNANVTLYAKWSLLLSYFWGAGDGSEDDPYIITTAEGLNLLATLVNSGSNDFSGKYFLQTADITLNGSFTPIGNNYSFDGTYDGGNKTISGLVVSETYDEYVGLFGRLFGGTVKNVILVSPNVTNSRNNGASVGAVVGSCEGHNPVVDNCHVINPTVSATGSGTNYVGAIIGEIWSSNATVTNCYFYDSNTDHNYAAYGDKDQGATVTNVGLARKVTLGSGMANVNPEATNTNGFVCNNESYYRENLTLTLTDNFGTIEGYTKHYYANGTDLNGSTYTVNSTDVTFTADCRSDGQQHEVTYVDAQGESHTTNAIPLDGSMTSLSGTYYVGANITFTSTIILNNNTTLILADGKTMNVGTSDNRISGEGIYEYSSYTLTIYGQSLDEATAGHLNIYNSGSDGIYLASYNQQSGNVTVNSTTQNYTISCEYFTLSGGKLNAINNHTDGLGITGSDQIRILGGQLDTYMSNNDYYALTSFKSITLGWTNATDHIYASRYKGTVNIASGQVFVTNDPTPDTITGNNIDKSRINGKTLRPILTGSGTTDDPYLISNAGGWDLFCDLIENSTSSFTDNVKLCANISVSRMAGSESKPFCGNFDGQDYTITFNYNTGLVNDPILDYIAPFRYVMGSIGNASHHATISNLNVDSQIIGENATHLAGLIANQKGLVDVTNCHVQVAITSTATADSYCAGLVSHADLCEGANHYYGNAYDGTLTISGCTVSGSILTYSKYAGGFVGMAEGKTSIVNSVSGVTIESYVSGDGNHGGFIGLQQHTLNYTDVKTTFEGCLFNGKLIKSENTTQCGGFIGWHDGGSLEIKHCLYAPADLDSGETEISDGSTFVGNGTVGSNCIYTRTLGTAQGKATRSIVAGQYVTISNMALINFLSNPDVYNVSGITSYDWGGISCGGTLYFCEDAHVSLVLSNDYTPAAPAGSVYGYTATAGTLEGTANPYTLTMPDDDVIINVDTENPIALDWGGTGTEDDPYMIYNKDQLDLVASRVIQPPYGNSYGPDEDHPNGYFFKLGADIVYPYTTDTENNFTPIGNGYPYPNFLGTFDGDGHTISGIRINDEYFYDNGYYFSYFGLFGELYGTVKNVILADAIITGSSNVGGIAGSNGGTLENNLVIDATISATYDNSHGIICGDNSGTLEHNYYVACTVGGMENATGVGCGYIYDDDEEDYITADITENGGAMPGNARTVEGYGSGNDKWAFIASPLTEDTDPNSAAVENIFSASEYDLYRLNQSAANGKEWENYKATTSTNHADFTSLVNGQGYLYATKETKTLVFSGTFNTDNIKTVDLVYDDTAELAGWNLVGNPFPRAAYINKPYYTLNSDGSAIVAEPVSSATYISPCNGVIIQGIANEVVTFSTTAPGSVGAAPNNGNLKIALTQANTRGASTGSATLLDKAIVSFNEGTKLGKFYFGTQDANIYIPQGTEEYAIVNAEVQGEMPVNFKANENGQYTLTVNTENVEMNYLHLIDNMTGDDIDLLLTPSYTFNAKTYDYESRFRLVFVANSEDGASTGSASFAFFANGNLIISNEGRATLQVIDVNGRILSSEEINGSVSKRINAPAGVYVLRLINGENVKTQKIVVR